MNNELTTTNNDHQLVLARSRVLLKITKKILVNIQKSNPSIKYPITLIHSDNVVESVAISSDGKYMISGSRDATIKLWDLPSGKEIQIFKGHKDCINSIAISHDSNRIVSASDDKTIKVWDLNSTKEIQTFKGHKNRVTSVIFSYDRKFIISASDDKTIKLWDINTGKVILE